MNSVYGVLPKLLTALCLGLAACTPAAKTPPIAQNSPQPGTDPVDMVTAEALFTKVCIGTLPKFRNAGAALDSQPFSQSSDTGTIFHQTLNLSFKVPPAISGQCSMVFASDEEAGTLGLIFALTSSARAGGDPTITMDPDSGASTSKTAGGARLEFIPTGSFRGQNYYRAVLIAAN